LIFSGFVFTGFWWDAVFAVGNAVRVYCLLAEVLVLLFWADFEHELEDGSLFEGFAVFEEFGQELVA
jgi:hypothetical protein